LLAVFFWQTQRVARESRRDSTQFTLAATVGGVAAILTDSFFNYQFAVPPICILLFTLLAIPFMLEKRNLGAEGAGTMTLPGPDRNPLRRFLWKVAASVAIAGVVGGLLWQQVRWLESEHLYQVACDLESRHDFASAEKTFRQSVAHNDLNGRAHFGLSRVLMAQGDFSNALVEIAKAERTYTDSHQEILRGQILMQMGKPGESLEAYRHAEWLDPTLGLGADHPPLNAPTNDAH
jgi:tetratricopeptide (TPR) repeat protein